MPFEHPKLAVVANVRQEDLASDLPNALAATGKVINGRAVQVLPAPKADAGLPTDEVPDHSMHTAPVSRSGFSKRRF
jgi:hypothetical protein